LENGDAVLRDKARLGDACGADTAKLVKDVATGEEGERKRKWGMAGFK
jgi:hypothetical protein